MLDGGFEHGEVGGGPTVDVADQDRLVVEGELAPGGDLDGFVEGAEAAGHDDKGMGSLEHLALAVVHGFGEDEVDCALVRDLAALEEGGNDAEDLAACCQGGVGGDAHEADIAAAVDEADACLAEALAEGLGGGAESGVVAEAGATEDGDGSGGWGHWQGYAAKDAGCASRRQFSPGAG